MDASNADTRLTEANLAVLDGQSSDILAQPTAETSIVEIPVNFSVVTDGEVAPKDTDQSYLSTNESRNPPPGAPPEPFPEASNNKTVLHDDPSLLQERLKIGLGGPVTDPRTTVKRTASTVPIPPSTPRQTLDSQSETSEAGEEMEGTPIAKAVAELMEETSDSEHRNESNTTAAIFTNENPGHPIFIMGAHKEGAERSDSTVTIPPSTPQQTDFDEEEDEGKQRSSKSVSLDGEANAAPVGALIADATPETPKGSVLGGDHFLTLSEEPESDTKTDFEPDLAASVGTPHGLHTTRTQTYPIVVLGAEHDAGVRSFSNLIIPPFMPQDNIYTEGVEPSDFSTLGKGSSKTKPPLIISTLDGKPEKPVNITGEDGQQVSKALLQSGPQVEPPEANASTSNGTNLDHAAAEPLDRQVEDTDLLSRRLNMAFKKPIMPQSPPLERTISTVPVPPLSPKRGSSSDSSAKSSPNVRTPPPGPVSTDNIPQESVQISEPAAENGMPSTPERSLSTITIPPTSPRSNLTPNPEDIMETSRGSPVPPLLSRDSGNMRLKLPKAGVPTVSVTTHDAGTPDLSFVDDARSERSVATSMLPIAPASPRFISPLGTPLLDQSGSTREPSYDFQRRPSNLATNVLTGANITTEINNDDIPGDAEEMAPDLQDAINSPFDNSDNNLPSTTLDSVPEDQVGAGLPSPSRPSPRQRGSSTSWLPNQRNSGWFNTVPQSPGRPSLEVAEGEFASLPRTRSPRDYPPEGNLTRERRKSINSCIIC